MNSLSPASNLRAPTRVSSAEVAKVTTPAPPEVWRDLYARDPESLLTQAPEWTACLCAHGGYEDASRLYEFADGQQLLVPMVRRKGLPASLSIRASLPHAWGSGGVLARREPSADELRAVFGDLLAGSGLTLSVTPNPRRAEVWRAAAPGASKLSVIPRRAHVLDLAGGFDAVWQERFLSKTRNKIRKAEKRGVVIECDTSGRLIPVFYDLLRRSVDRWADQQNEPRWLSRWRAAQRDPQSKFEHLARTLGDACRVRVAWHDGQPVAATITLLGPNTADYIRGVMDKARAAPVNANDLLQSVGIQEACEAGCRYYHLGESAWSGPLSAFKERFGAQAYTYDEYRLERLPVTRLDRLMREGVKRAIGFKDASR